MLVNETSDIEIRLLLEGICLKYGSDFRDYSPASVKRRIALVLEKLNCVSVSRLQERVLADPEAYDVVLQYLTVPTSEMFRDPLYYKALRDKVVPVLQTYPSLKIWIAGCSTGEELYSFAILLRECGLLERTLIYATDINPLSLQRARQGIYSLDRLQQYTSQYQKAGGTGAFSDYYRAAYDSVIFDASLRVNVVFADHSLATDSVFGEMHLISCRNVLIYFNRRLQDRAFALFRDSLTPRGFLGLGSKETVRFSSSLDYFDEFDADARVYRTRRSR